MAADIKVNDAVVYGYLRFEKLAMSIFSVMCMMGVIGFSETSVSPPRTQILNTLITKVIFVLFFVISLRLLLAVLV